MANYTLLYDDGYLFFANVYYYYFIAIVWCFTNYYIYHFNGSFYDMVMWYVFVCYYYCMVVFVVVVVVFNKRTALFLFSFSLSISIFLPIGYYNNCNTTSSFINHCIYIYLLSNWFLFLLLGVLRRRISFLFCLYIET